MKDYKKILEGVVNIISTTEKSDIGFANICTYIGENCPELKESEDEKIRKALIEMVHDTTGDALWVDYNVHKEECIAWLEKKGEQKPYGQRAECLDCQFNYAGECKGSCSTKRGEQKSFAKYKVGDTIYYNSFGRLVNFVIANIVEDGTDNPMYEDKDGNSVFQNDIVERMPDDKAEPKFKVGDRIRMKNTSFLFQEIVSIKNNAYYFSGGLYLTFENQDEWESEKPSTIKFDEPDFERMEAEYCTTLDVPHGVLDGMIQSKMCSAYRQGLEDMWNKLKSK